MWALPDGHHWNGELWAVVFAVPGLVSMESNDEGRPHGIYFSIHGCPSELVFLDLEGMPIPSTVFATNVR